MAGNLGSHRDCKVIFWVIWYFILFYSLSQLFRIPFFSFLFLTYVLHILHSLCRTTKNILRSSWNCELMTLWAGRANNISLSSRYILWLSTPTTKLYGGLAFNTIITRLVNTLPFSTKMSNDTASSPQQIIQAVNLSNSTRLDFRNRIKTILIRRLRLPPHISSSTNTVQQRRQRLHAVDQLAIRIELSLYRRSLDIEWYADLRMLEWRVIQIAREMLSRRGERREPDDGRDRRIVLDSIERLISWVRFS